MSRRERLAEEARKALVADGVSAAKAALLAPEMARLLEKYTDPEVTPFPSRSDGEGG